jgi:hypothetical protein
MHSLQHLSTPGDDVPPAHFHCITRDISDAFEFACSHPGSLSGATVALGQRPPLAPRCQHRV